MMKKTVISLSDNEKDREYVEQLIADMQDAEGQLFTRKMLQQRMGYIKACMNNVNVTLSEEEIYDILEV